jgi:hemoglobin
MMNPERSLYSRLGGYDALAAAVDDLLPRLTSDSQIGVYWRGKCRDSMKRDRQFLVDFLCAATGGPSSYTGRDMKMSHEGLGITDSDWSVLIRHTIATLEEFAVPETEQQEFLSLIDTWKADIVEAPRVATTRA